MTGKENPVKRALGASPFDAAPTHDEHYLLARCDRLNFEFRWMRGTRWHYVEPANPARDEPAKIMIVEGATAADVWTVHEKGRLDYGKMDPAELRKLERRCRWLIRHGTIQHQAVAAE